MSHRIIYDDDYLTTPEETVLTDNMGFIRNCAWNFIAASSIPRWKIDDVFQEAAIAYLTWFRSLRDDEMPDDWRNYAASAIRFHLLDSFEEEKRARFEATDNICDDEDAHFEIYFRDWVSRLNKHDQALVRAKLEGRTPSRSAPRYRTYRRQMHKLRRSYDDYFAG